MNCRLFRITDTSMEVTMSKKVISLIAALMLIVCMLAGCGKEKKDNTETAPSTVTETQQADKATEAKSDKKSDQTETTADDKKSDDKKSEEKNSDEKNAENDESASDKQSGGSDAGSNSESSQKSSGSDSGKSGESSKSGTSSKPQSDSHADVPQPSFGKYELPFIPD